MTIINYINISYHLVHYCGTVSNVRNQNADLNNGNCDDTTGTTDYLSRENCNKDISQVLIFVDI